VTPSLENERGEHHVEGDLMTVAASKLGRLTNRMRPSGACEAWEFGLTALIAALTRRARDKSKP
jgi:fumarylacetoacetate (FAA) hydrolase family protein